MPSKLTELASLCDRLSSGKAVERKKAGEKLKALLSTSDVLKQLDKTSSQDGFGVCWASVFEAAGAALLLELKGQRSSSTSTIKQPEMYSVVKFVLQQATSKTQDGKPVLNPEVVFEHIAVMLADYSHILASEYAFLLTNYFLTPTLWKHWATADLHMLSRILIRYIKGLSKSLRGFNAGPISLAIENLTDYMLQRIDVRPMKFLVHFKEFFINTAESSSQILQHILASVNNLSEKGAVNSRLHLAQFGRDIAMRLLQMWKGSKGDVLKQEIIRFFRLQLVVNEQKAGDMECTWQDVLWKLYEVLCMEVGNARTSLKLAGDKLPALWTDDFVNLLAHVCLILLPEGERLNEVSQSVAESQYSSGRPSKRRRIQTGWESLKSNLMESNDYQSQMMWIRVIKVVVQESDDNSMDREQLRDVLEVMLQLLSNTKRSIVLTELHSCLLVLVEENRLQTPDVDRLWSKATILSISLVERSHPDFYGLLSQLLVKGKLRTKSQLVSLIKRTVAAPLSMPALYWLAQYISRYQLALCPLLSLSEKELEAASGDTSSQELCQQELWQHVWVMRQLIQTVNHEEGLCRVVEASETVSPQLFGYIMAALVCKESLPPATTDKELSPSYLHTLLDMYKSMVFSPETKSPQSTAPVRPTVLDAVYSEANSLLVEKMELSVALLDQSEYTMEYIEDSLWLTQMVIAYLTTLDVAVDDEAIFVSLKVLWTNLMAKIKVQLPMSAIDKCYLSALLSVVSTRHSILTADQGFTSALISYVHSVLDKTLLSQGSYSSVHSSDSASGSTFAIPELPEVSSKHTNKGDNAAPSIALTYDDKQLLAALQILVYFSVSDLELCEDVMSLLCKASSDQSVTHALVVKEALSTAAVEWQHVDHSTVLTLLFHLRGLIESYHTDPQMGASCLRVLNKLISLVSTAEKLANEEREDVGGKIFLIVNGLVMQLFERKEDTDGSFQLFPMYGVEYRLALVDTLQLLVKADSKGGWKASASKQTAILLDAGRYLVKALLDRDYVVRRTATHCIDVLFNAHVDGKVMELASKGQEKWFDYIYTEIRSILAVSGVMNDMDRQDEEITRTATLLSLFQKIILSSAACSKKSLCALILCLDEENQHIDSQLIARVLESAIPHSPYSSAAELCKLSLGYVAKEWVAMEFKLDAFPVTLFGDDDISTFYSKHLSMFARQTFGMETAWTQLLNIVSKEACDVVNSHLASLSLQILPRIANNMSHCSNSKILLEEIHRLLATRNLKMVAVLKEKLADLMYALYTSVWDFAPEYPSEPAPNPPHYTKSQVETTLVYLLKLFNKNGVTGDTLMSILSTKPVSVSGLHCKLAAYVTSGKHSYELRQRVGAYLHFIHELLPELKRQSLQEYQLHITESIVSVFTNIISELQQPCPRDGKLSTQYKHAVIAQLVCCLQELFNTLVSQSVQILCGVVPRVTYCLVSLSSHPNAQVSTASVNLLNHIWATHGTKFSHLLETMEPLSDVYGWKVPLEAPKHSLIQLISTYCSAPRDRSHSRSYLLSLINKELDSTDLQSNVLLEDGTSALGYLANSLHQHLNICCQDEREQALRCLNVLGVSFVSKSRRSQALQRRDVRVDEKLSDLFLEYGDEDDRRDFIIVSHILHYLLYDSQDTMSLCDSVLAAIFGSKAGASVIQSLKNIDEGTEHMLAILAPYVTHKCTVPSALSTDLSTSLHQWNSYRTVRYEQWISGLASTISTTCTSQLLRLLSPLCLAKAEFCELVLPFLIHDILEKGNHRIQATLSSLITHIATEVLDKQGDMEDTKLGQRVGSTVLSIVQYLRTKANKHFYSGRVKVHTAWHDNFWLSVDYALLSRLALLVKDYATAALFAELRIYQTRQAPAGSLPEFKAQQVMIEIYSALDDTDILYGWGVNKLTDSRSRLTHYNHEMRWSRALTLKDSMLSDKMDEPLSHSLESLMTSGLTQLLDTFLQNMESTGSTEGSTEGNRQIREMRYQQALANMSWDGLPTATRLSDDVGFHECLYMLSKAVTKDSLTHADSLLGHMTVMCENTLLEGSQHNSCRVIDSLADLELVNVLKDIVTSRQLRDVGSAESLIARWISESDRHRALAECPSERELKHQECRLLLCSLLHKDRQSVVLDRHLVQSTLALSSTCRQSNLSSLSEHMLDKFNKLHPLLWNTECDMEHAMVYWHLDEADRAMNVMRKCLLNLESQALQNPVEAEARKVYSVHARAMRTYGSWLGSTKLKSPETITEKYLLPAVEMAEKSASPHAMEDAYHTLADFADREYERLCAYMKSVEFQDKLNLHKIQLEQAEGLRQLPKDQLHAVRLYRNTLKHNRDVNELEITAIREAFVQNMHRAITNHIRTMQYGSNHDLLSVFRLVAIWFDNESREDIRWSIRELIPGSVPSYKFLPLICQLTTRLSTESSELQVPLRRLILKSAKEHPHHVIPLLFALKSAATDSARGAAEETNSRATAAKEILTIIATESRQQVKDYGTLTTALIQLANVRGKDNVKLDPSKYKLAALSSLSSAHVLTHHLKPRPSCDYGDVPHVYKYSKECKTALGVNNPRIIYCIGSDGNSYKQLCKGQDDTRQDAVMQQVFSLVNDLLRAEQSTRSMSIRTYQVIPLSQRSGLLQWCEGTIPVGVWLGTHSTNGAHKRYHPEGWSLSKCRQKMQQFQRSWSDEQYCKAYLEICRNLPPVLRHFFLEEFKEAELWLQARRNYSQSVATSSIVGYILGIGDRHTNNMLLDEKTGELIHIDFGVAFDRGKVLPIPETVPFRLSRDIVDGLGPTGVDGAFRRCCEKTMTVLRHSERVINTILQVLIDDPLLDWILTAEKLEQKQKNQARLSADCSINIANQSAVSGTEANAAGDVTVSGRSSRDSSKHQQAANALLKVRHKLQGYEQNSQLSVSGQVNYLIQQATDPCNLCKLFDGWQPFM